MESEFIDLIEYISDHFYPEWQNVNEDCFGFIKRGDSYDDEVVFFIDYNQISVDYYGMRLVRKFKKLRNQLIPYNIRNNVYPDTIANDIGCFGTNLNDQNLNFVNFNEEGIDKDSYGDLGLRIIESFDHNYAIVHKKFTNEESVLEYIYNSKLEDLNSILFIDEVVKILDNRN